MTNYKSYNGSNAWSQCDNLGDTGRHRDLKIVDSRNLIEGTIQSPSKTIWVIQVDIYTLKNCWMIYVGGQGD